MIMSNNNHHQILLLLLLLNVSNAWISTTTINKYSRNTQVYNIGYLSDYFDEYSTTTRGGEEGSFEDEDFGVVGGGGVIGDDEEGEGGGVDDDGVLRNSQGKYLWEVGSWYEQDRVKNKIEKPRVESPNSIYKYIAIIMDSDFDTEGRSPSELFQNRLDKDQMIEHVFWARCANIFNATVNNETRADCPFSYPILSKDVLSEIGHVIGINAQSYEDAMEFLCDEPYIESLTPGMTVKQRRKKIEKHGIIYRWMHVKDSKLRMDDGRGGFPTMMIGMDEKPLTKETLEIRSDYNMSHYEYLIRSERVIQAGPLFKVDHKTGENSIDAVGNIVMFNAPNRTAAIEFAENDPLSLAGAYGDLRVHRYNTIDVSGKHVAEDRWQPVGPAGRSIDLVRGVMQRGGYPVDDEQTPWLW